MTRNVQLALQAIAVLGQFLLPAWPGIQPECLNFGHAVVGGLQAIVALIGHAYNPDGTPAGVAYDKGEMKIVPPKGE